MRFVATSLAVFLVLALPAWAWLARAHRTWWDRRWVRRSFAALIGLGLVSHAAVALGRGLRLPVGQVAWASAVLSGCLITVLALDVSLPLGALVRWVAGLLWRERRRAAPVPLAMDVGDAPDAPSADEAPVEAQGQVAPAGGLARRRFLELAALAAPAASVVASLDGVVGSFRDPALPHVRLAYRALPEGLEALRILQLTDLHLGIYRQLDHLERVLDRATHLRPHLVVLTGDVADDLDLLPPALRLVEQLRPPLGTFSCLGNHEHYRGVREVARAHARSSVDLLRDESREVRVGDTRLRIAGCDDPGRLHGATGDFYAASTRRALGRREDPGYFSILLCHRPAGAAAGVRRGASLVLAGHTHGAQLGAHGRSVLEPLLPGAFLRGPYHFPAPRAAAEEAWLYTSSGFGHWLPFRLGCEAEAPLIELRRT